MIKVKVFLPLYLIFFSLLLFGIRGIDNISDDPVTLSNLNRILGVLLSILLVFVYFGFKKTFISLPNSFLVYSTYILICGISIIFYSENRFFDFWKLLEIIAIWSLGVFLYYQIMIDKLNTYELVDKVVSFFKFLLITVLVGIILNPSNALRAGDISEDAILPFRFEGFLFVLNSLSIGTFASIVLYNEIIDIRITGFRMRKIIWPIISMVCLIGAQSRTPIFGLIAALFIFFFFIEKQGKFFKWFVGIISLILIMDSFWEIIAVIKRGHSNEVLFTMSGRTILWSRAWETFIEGSLLQKIIGFGFSSAERRISLESSNGTLETLDSTFFSGLISSGILGVTVLISLFINIIFKLWKKAKMISLSNYKLYSLALGFSIILAFKSITTTTLNYLSYYTLLFIILLLVAERKDQNFI